MSTFNSRITEITIEMGDLHVTTITALEYEDGGTSNKASVNDFHISKFTAMEWQELAILIETAIREVTK